MQRCRTIVCTTVCIQRQRTHEHNPMQAPSIIFGFVISPGDFAWVLLFRPGKVRGNVWFHTLSKWCGNTEDCAV